MIEILTIFESFDIYFVKNNSTKGIEMKRKNKISYVQDCMRRAELPKILGLILRRQNKMC